jgi:ATP-dependent Clp protease adaptor protein ClpS
LINLGGFAEPGIRPNAVAPTSKFARLRQTQTGPIFSLSIQLVGSGRPGAAIWKACLGTQTMAPAGDHHQLAVRFLVGTSNACAMLQLNSRFDLSEPAAGAASAPRMGSDENRTGGTGGPATSVIAKVKPKTKRPNLYRVLILNDDYTPMEFVVHVLEKFFQKDVEAATKIMLHVHHHGIGECGVFTYEIAETKVTQVMDFARKHQHPLQCVMEKK